MSEQRPLKKRALENNNRTDFEYLHQQQQVESLQAELDHERAARQLDTRKYNQKVRSLEQQVAFAVQEAAEAKELLEQTVEQTDRRVEQLISERDRSLQLNRQLQLKIADNDDASHSSTDIEHYKAKCENLEEQLNAQVENEAAYRREIEELKETIELKLENVSKVPAETHQHPLLEQAPAAVLSELNRTRIKLAETERKGRQLSEKYKDIEVRNRQLISNCERHQGTAKRLNAVTTELQCLNRKYEQVRAEIVAWKDFGSSLGTILHTKETTEGNHPPETSTVLRFLKDTQKDCQAAQQAAFKYKQECDQMRSELVSAQTKTSDSVVVKRLQREWETKLELSEQKLIVSQQQASLYQRESDSLRALIATFEQQMDTNPEAIDPAMKVLQVRCDVSTEQLKVLRADYKKCLADLETTKSEKLILAAELDKVREKFVKLRDALKESKQSAAAAEERAVAAEQLSGKGSFDPNRTRVLHLTETPLVQALKEEVQVLKRQLQTLKASSSSPHMTGDPEKLNQRLKETFRGQIATFREGVYLATGYKIDMLTADTQQPTFRLRSVFAEHEDDHLLLRWPKDSQSLDILNTDFAKQLSTQPCYDYMTKFHSMPAFLASVSLSLFEKQTVMM